MVIWIFHIFTTIIIGLFVRFIYCIAFNNGITSKNKFNSIITTLIILGSGGHTTEMLRIVKNLNFNKYKPRIYVHADSDKMSIVKLEEIEGNSDDYKVITIFRSREVGQSYISSVLTTLIAIKSAFIILINYKPDLILCNGPGTGVPLCLVSFLLKLIFLNRTKIIFIESFCRVKSLSLTGKILYYFVDDVIIQWPLLTKESKNVHLIK